MDSGSDPPCVASARGPGGAEACHSDIQDVQCQYQSPSLDSEHQVIATLARSSMELIIAVDKHNQSRSVAGVAMSGGHSLSECSA